MICVYVPRVEQTNKYIPRQKTKVVHMLVTKFVQTWT